MKKKDHDLKKSKVAHQNSIERLREEVKKPKENKNRIDKKSKHLEKVKSGKSKNEIDSNCNISNFPPRSCSSAIASSSTQPSTSPTRRSHLPASTSPPITPTRRRPPVETTLPGAPSSHHSPPGYAY